MSQHQLQVLGYIARTHGVKGAVLLKLNAKFELNIEEPVFVDLQGPVPFFIASHKQGSGGAIVELQWIDSMEKAENLVGKKILAYMEPAEIEEEGGELVGYKFHDLASGRKGVVLELRPLDHHPLLVVEMEDKEVMIPFVEELLEVLNHDDGIIEMNVPEGLLDL